MHLYSPAPGARARGRVARPCAPATATRTRGKADGGGGGREEAGGVADPVSLCSAGVGGGIAVHAPETPLISSQFVSAIFQPIANATTSRKPAEYRDLHAILPRGGGRREGGGWKEGEEGGGGECEDRLVARMRRGRAGNSQRRAIKTFGGWERLVAAEIDRCIAVSSSYSSMLSSSLLYTTLCQMSLLCDRGGLVPRWLLGPFDLAARREAARGSDHS